MRVMLFGTMGTTGPAALAGLRECCSESAPVEAKLVDFPQNIFRDEAGYRRELRRAMSEFRPDVVMPVGHPLALSRMKEALALDDVRACVESEDKILLLDSKVRFSRFASELGIPQPSFYASAEDADFSRVLVFKRDVSFGGHGVHLPRNVDSLRNLIAHQRPGEGYLIEDFIEGEDYSVDAVRLAGTFRASAYRCLVGRGTSGPSLEREMTCMPQLEEYAMRILDAIDYNGVCGFDFRVDQDGKAYILEANPRFTAGLGDQIACGFNIPAMLLGL